MRVFGQVDHKSDGAAPAGAEDRGGVHFVLTAAALDEIRQLKHPPAVVRRTLEVVHILLNAHQHRNGLPRQGVEWPRVLRTLVSEGLERRLQAFDIDELRRSPGLAHDLRANYFDEPPSDGGGADRRVATRRARRPSLSEGHEALNPQRVRRASAAAAELFAWAARSVTDAALDCGAEGGQKDASEGEGEGVGEAEHASLPVQVQQDEEADVTTTVEEEELDISVGFFATCPGGHGVEVGVAGLPPMCGVCEQAVVKSALAASCRECRFIICEACRSGAFLAAPLLHAGGSAESGPPRVKRLRIAGFRYLRRGEDPPPPSAVEDCLQASSCFAAWWGRNQDRASRGILEEGIRVELRPSHLLGGAARGGLGAIAAVVEAPMLVRKQRRQNAVEPGRVFDLCDARSLGATFVVLIAGRPAW